MRMMYRKDLLNQKEDEEEEEEVQISWEEIDEWVRIQNRRVKWRKESKLQNDQNTLQYHHLETIASQSSTGHQAHVESNNFRESLYETHLNETSYGTMNLRPDLEEQEEQTNKSVYLKNFYEPKYDVYPIYVRKKVLITELIVRHHS
ncbi:uncharacterized protein LOC126842456 [Adelges cooleyi]|uniref:uncharacterized protein LOC126842450 n=1 Tax=Adelges cooleyi TaxID=133065 RepID=UPI00217FB074|nr:uncharacterized protein LOC126842450 [Adelges cooleyi]XP_050435426.1 uncharacterized protein LOC126842451 [Adelges cooleyi]XP_050435429.1 uncharacterized protein LOC126842454 [Adelges cooleyi]XP_050435432.1 uncharacterized protein LOC126842456 [Adelges cooleyi]